LYFLNRPEPTQTSTSLIIMISQILLWAHFSLAIYAQEIQFPASGTLNPGPGGTPQILQAFEGTGRQPNASDSIIFFRTSNESRRSGHRASISPTWQSQIELQTWVLLPQAFPGFSYHQHPMAAAVAGQQ
jgi:hypothetical protein